MKELVELIAKSLVDCPDEVVVNETIEEDTITIELKVAPDDMDKVIEVALGVTEKELF